MRGDVIDQERPYRLPRRTTLVLAGAGLALALPPVRPAPAADAGIVSALRGAASATRAGATRALHVGATVHAGDSLRTGASARLLVTMVDGSTLALGEQSQVVLTTVTTDAGGSMVFDLLAGLVRAVVGPEHPDRFAVRGRVAVAAARSTDFIVETETRLTSVFVATGEVAVDETYGGAAVVLGAGQGVDIRRGVTTGVPRNWGQGRINDVVVRTAING